MPAGRYSIADGNLTISDIAEDDRGVYVCSARNDAAAVAAEAELLVENVPPRAPYNLTAAPAVDALHLSWVPGECLTDTHHHLRALSSGYLGSAHYVKFFQTSWAVHIESSIPFSAISCLSPALPSLFRPTPSPPPTYIHAHHFHCDVVFFPLFLLFSDIDTNSKKNIKQNML